MAVEAEVRVRENKAGIQGIHFGWIPIISRAFIILEFHLPSPER